VLRARFGMDNNSQAPKRRIVQAFAGGFAHRPQTTFGTVNADVLEKLSPGFVRMNFCEMIARSPFRD
jgi:hypothetical protein